MFEDDTHSARWNRAVVKDNIAHDYCPQIYVVSHYGNAERLVLLPIPAMRHEMNHGDDGCCGTDVDRKLCISPQLWLNSWRSNFMGSLCRPHCMLFIIVADLSNAPSADLVGPLFESRVV